MPRLGGLLDDEPMHAAYLCVRDWLHVQVRGCTRGMVVAGVVAGSLLLMPAPADAAPPRGGKLARPDAPAAAAPAASPAAATPPRLSPYAIAARQRAQAASGVAHAPTVPPSMKHTRQAIGRQSRR